jgi:large subunit ribosomal protein L7Ae
MPVYVDFDVPADLEDDAIEALEVARDTGTVKKGTNETTKAIERGSAKLAVVAEDVQPEEIVMHLPELADEKDVPVIFVAEQDDVGHASGLEVGSAAAAIVDAGDAPELTRRVRAMGNGMPVDTPTSRALTRRVSRYFPFNLVAVVVLVAAIDLSLLLPAVSAVPGYT